MTLGDFKASAAPIWWFRGMFNIYFRFQKNGKWHNSYRNSDYLDVNQDPKGVFSITLLLVSSCSEIKPLTFINSLKVIFLVPSVFSLHQNIILIFFFFFSQSPAFEVIDWCCLTLQFSNKCRAICYLKVLVTLLLNGSLVFLWKLAPTHNLKSEVISNIRSCHYSRAHKKIAVFWGYVWGCGIFSPSSVDAGCPKEASFIQLNGIISEGCEEALREEEWLLVSRGVLGFPGLCAAFHHASPNGRSGFAQLRLFWSSENAIYEPTGDTDGAEGNLEHPQHDHVPLVKDEILIPIHSALIPT